MLTEITLISARSELYKNFLLKSISNDLSATPSTPHTNTSSTNANKTNINDVKQFINSSNLECAIQELIGQYSILENYFMNENIDKAIQMDVCPKDSLFSSVVDDVFFIIKKCIK